LQTFNWKNLRKTFIKISLFGGFFVCVKPAP
jgi:hypothetical protein